MFSFFALFPAHLVSLLFVFFRNFVAPFGVDAGGGGSSTPETAPTPPVTSAPVTAFDVTAGKTVDLARNVIPFSCPLQLPIDAHGLFASGFNLFEHSGITVPMGNALGGVLIGNLRVHIIALFDADKISASHTAGVSAIVSMRQARATAPVCPSFNTQLHYPGTVPLQMGPMGSTNGELSLQLGVHGVYVAAGAGPTLGAPPAILCQGAAVGCSNVTLMVSGDISRHGLNQSSF
jgi:hypothetical protein